jgi:hypothetical protein
METLQRTANRGSVSTGYDIDNSCKFEAIESESLIRTPSSATNRRTFTISFWIKLNEIKANNVPLEVFQNGSNFFLLNFGSDGKFTIYNVIGGTDYGKVTERVFRDTSAWYHFAIIFDTTDSTATDRFKLYVNGVRETDFSTDYGDFPLNYETLVNTTNPHNIGFRDDNDAFSSYYLAEYHFIDGTAKAHTDFGEFDSVSGIWIPKEYDGSYGTNGFYLDFKDGANLGHDKVAGGNSNDFTESNLTAADQATDTPTNNFCILNNNFIGLYYRTAFYGGTYINMNGINQYGAYTGTFGLRKGKWYYETFIDMRDSTYGLTVLVGIHTLQGNYHDTNFMVDATGQNSTAAYEMHGGNYYSWDSGSRVVDSNPAGLGSAQVGQFVGIALNLDDNQISFTVNGSAISNASNLALNDAADDIAAGVFALPAFSVYTNNHTVNFGGYTKATISSAQSDANGYGAFEFAPPSGYYAICSKNLAEYG